MSELVDKLMAKQSIFQEVGKTIFYDEIIDLVSELNNISSQYNYEPLRNYTHKLEKFMEEFEWQNLSQCLAEFPQIVSDIELELLKTNKNFDESE
ncbi:MAG: hypothetical protein QNJ74_08125 [Trichodesmium sp. MO_231.B1]|nr:hypothetical protein [Trichodesmium sp. MO_231.B1]